MGSADSVGEKLAFAPSAKANKVKPPTMEWLNQISDSIQMMTAWHKGLLFFFLLFLFLLHFHFVIICISLFGVLSIFGLFIKLDFRDGFSFPTRQQPNSFKGSDVLLKESGIQSTYDDMSPLRSNSLTNSYELDEHSDFERLRGPYVNSRDLDPQSDAALSDVSSQPEFLYNPSIEECWVVSPSPCFTGQDALLEKPKSSSMEDLLIEHPSMSIYQLRGRPPLHRETLHQSTNSIPSDMDTGLGESLCAQSRSGSLENRFHQPRDPLTSLYHHRPFRSPTWTSDSESSSLDRSFSSPRRAGEGGSDIVAFVTPDDPQNQEPMPPRNENLGHSSPGGGKAQRKNHIRMQTRLTHGNLERNNKVFQPQTQKKQRYRRTCYSTFSSSNNKKRSS